MAVLGDICVSLWHEAKRVVRPRRQLGEDDIRHLVQETLASATMIAVTATALNAAVRGHTGHTITIAAEALPTEPRVFQRLNEEFAFGNDSAIALDTLERLYAAVDEAREAMTSAENVPAGRERHMRIHRHKAVLQDLCGLALSAVGDVELLAASARIPPDLRIPNVALLLKSARDGGMPCLDADGRLATPEWLQRRGRQRWAVRFCVDVVSDRSADVATALDISTTGIGIACFGSFRRGDHVTMRVPDGRVLQGVIAWRHLRRAGIKLDQPLEPSDPLLGAAYRVLERTG